MILSVSRRTDIPCWYPEWFMNRLRAGFVLVRNPVNPSQISRVILSPEVVDAIVFWTKDPAALLPHLAELEDLGYPCCFQFTLNAYGRAVEPGLRDEQARIDTFLELSRRIGRKRMLWRYDPILLAEDISPAWHLRQFRRLCELLAPHARQVTVSFVDMYARLRRAAFRPPDRGEARELARGLSQIAGEHDLDIRSCAEPLDLAPWGIRPGACIDKAVLEDVTGCALTLSPDPGQRTHCGCMASVDIGAYDSCPNGCVYCYATHSPERTVRTRQRHDPRSPLLIGWAEPGARITDRPLRSNRGEQMKMT